jgi:hypothetical protein
VKFHDETFSRGGVKNGKNYIAERHSYHDGNSGAAFTVWNYRLAAVRNASDGNF